MNAEDPKARFRILQVTREWPGDQRYGLGQSLRVLVEGLKVLGHDVRYLSQADLGVRSRHLLASLFSGLERRLKTRPDSTEWASLLAGLIERLNMGRLAFKVARREGSTHVHLHDPLLALGFRLLCLCSLRRIPNGLTMHGFGSYMQAIHEDGAFLGSLTHRGLRALERQVLLHSDWVIFPTEAALRQTQRDLCCYPCPSRWHVIPHAIPRRSLPSREAARQRLGWRDQDLYILAVGRLVAVKNFELAIKALKKSNLGTAHLVLLGEGDRAPYQQLAASLGIESQVLFDAVDDPGVYYAAADLGVSASNSESFGLSNLEALAAGLPLIATAVGGVPEVLGAGARWVPRGDPETLADALNDFGTSLETRSLWREKALRRAAAWPSEDAMVEAYEAIYQKASS